MSLIDLSFRFCSIYWWTKFIFSAWWFCSQSYEKKLGTMAILRHTKTGLTVVFFFWLRGDLHFSCFIFFVFMLIFFNLSFLFFLCIIGSYIVLKCYQKHLITWWIKIDRFYPSPHNFKRWKIQDASNNIARDWINVFCCNK